MIILNITHPCEPDEPEIEKNLVTIKGNYRSCKSKKYEFRSITVQYILKCIQSQTFFGFSWYFTVVSGSFTFE